LKFVISILKNLSDSLTGVNVEKVNAFVGGTGADDKKSAPDSVKETLYNFTVLFVDIANISLKAN